MNPYPNDSGPVSTRLHHLKSVALPGNGTEGGSQDLDTPHDSLSDPPFPLAGQLLLIDEAGTDATSLRSMLLSEVLMVISVDSSVQAFMAVRSGQYDVILARLNAALEHPFKAFDMLQSNGLIDDTPFIYLAREEDVHLARPALNRGADDVLTLPATGEDLSRAIAARLRRWRTRGTEFKAISDSAPAMELPFSSRTVDASVIVRGACQAYKRQHVQGTLLLDVEKVRVLSPITSLLRVVLTLLQALDTHEEKPGTLRISLKQVDSAAVLTIRTSASETELAPGLELSNEYPQRLEPISRAISLLGGTFEYGNHPVYPAARVSIPCL